MLDRASLTLPAIVGTLLALTCALEWGGYFERLERGVEDTRAKLLSHAVESDIVIVGIDAHSLQELSEWPWPRRHHARLLQMLSRSEPRQVFIDVDFSAYTNSTDDALFEKALAEWPGTPVLLASHFQPVRQSGAEIVLTRPLPQFAAHALETSVMLRPSGDGLVRGMQSSWPLDRGDLHAVFSHGADEPLATTVAIDFAIQPSSFAYVSYSDLLNGEIDASALRGKRIYVGATAVELGDILAVPVFQALPGIVVQALASETVKAGLIVTPPIWLYIALLAALAIAYAALARTQDWRRNAFSLVLILALLTGVTVLLYAKFRIDLAVVPFVVVVLGIFAATVLLSLEKETWRALAYAVGLKRQDALLTSIVESSSDCIVCMDANGVVRTANVAATRLFANEKNTLVGNCIDLFIPGLAGAEGDALPALSDALTERSALRANGDTFPVEIALSQVAFDKEQLFTAIVRDISERKARQRLLEHQAWHDSLTGLPNRAALTAHLDKVLGRGAQRKSVALLMLDLCRFKEVNDTLGHDTGDQVLREVAQRFASTLGQRAFISRIGGDEFTVVLTQIANLSRIDELVESLVSSLKTPIKVHGVGIEVGLSIGIALSPDHTNDARELLRHADVAMYTAKRRGTTMEYYDRQHDWNTVRRLGMVGDLRAAIAGDAVELHYQPQVNLQTGRAESVEALLRWHHPMLGNVSPEEFVTLAESTELIAPLTNWTIDRAFADMRVLRAENPKLRVAVNLSARVLQDTAFPARLAGLMRKHGVAPDGLELEITESAMMLDPERALRTVHELHAMGVLISIDDYGTGFSSLGYLRDLQAHSLKLDKSFVIDLETLEHNRVIVESTVRMAHALGLQIVAEGVETAWVQNYLQAAGYDIGQGYLFSKPMALTECCAWLSDFNAAPQRVAS
jgi:diguanylate cyclase (GGDEF)-like protein/PAS domain S-box-containing protein